MTIADTYLQKAEEAAKNASRIVKSIHDASNKLSEAMQKARSAESKWEKVKAKLTADYYKTKIAVLKTVKASWEKISSIAKAAWNKLKALWNKIIGIKKKIHQWKQRRKSLKAAVKKLTKAGKGEATIKKFKNNWKQVDEQIAKLEDQMQQLKNKSVALDKASREEISNILGNMKAEMAKLKIRRAKYKKLVKSLEKAAKKAER